MDGGMKVAVALALIVAASAGVAAPKAVRPVVTDWRSVATRADAKRLHDWRDAFVRGLDEARAAAKSADVARDGTLLRPDVALPDPAIPAGRYRCRTVKLGRQGEVGLGYIAYPGFSCTVTTAGTLQRFAKTTGSQRPVGTLYPGGDRRLVFLGTILLGDEMRALKYGVDPDRDMAGMVERIGPARWRLLVPYPRFESTMDVTELVPAD
jgi:Domain of unknown function (DUF4893)